MPKFPPTVGDSDTSVPIMGDCATGDWISGDCPTSGDPNASGDVIEGVREAWHKEHQTTEHAGYLARTNTSYVPR